MEKILNQKSILIVSEYFYPEEFKINEVALAWIEKGYKVGVVTTVPTYPAGEVFPSYQNCFYQYESYQGIDIYRVKSVTGYKKSLIKKILKYFSFMFFATFVTLKIGKKYDFIFGFDIGSLTCMVPAVILHKVYKKRVVLWVLDIWPDSVYAYGFKKTKLLEFFLNYFVRFVYKNTSAFAISSKGFYDKISQYLDTQKEILYAPNWSDQFKDKYESFSFSQDEKIHFTFAGNVGRVQNLDNIIKAFCAIDKKLLQKAQLNIIGDGSYLENLKQLTQKEHFFNIFFWGRKPRKDMQKYFRASDFLIVSLVNKPIFSLTVPAKLQTYIATKKPIIAILDGDAAKIVIENNLGFSAHPSDLESIKNLFEASILLSPKQKEIFMRNSQKLSETIFNREKIIDNLLQLTIKGDN